MSQSVSQRHELIQIELSRRENVNLSRFVANCRSAAYNRAPIELLSIAKEFHSIFLADIFLLASPQEDFLMDLLQLYESYLPNLENSRSKCFTIYSLTSSEHDSL